MAILRMTREEYMRKYGQKPTNFGLTSSKPTLPSKEDRNIVQKVGGFLGIEKLGRRIGSELVKLTPEGKELKSLKESGQVSPEEYKEITTGGVSNREAIGSAITTATMLTPVGLAAKAGLGARVLAGAGMGYGLDVGAKLQDVEKPIEEAFAPGIGTAVGAVLPLIGAVVGKVNPKKIEQINLRMTPHEKQLMMKQGKDIPAWLAKKKLVGTPEVRYQKIKKLYDSMENNIDDVVKKTKVEYPKNAILDEVRKIPEQFKDDITGYNEVLKATKKVEAFIQNKSPMGINAELLNTYKRNLWKSSYSKNNTDVLNEALHAIGSRFKDLLDAGVPGLQKLNQEYSNIILAKRILFKAMHRSEIGLTGKLLGGAAGAGIGGSMGGGIGAAADQTL